MLVRRIIGPLAISLCLLGAPAAAQVVINQAKALAGGVTAGDTRGFPITISEKGAYILTSNLTITTAVVGILITAHDVTIDFNGFALNGNGIGTTAITGEYNTAIKNGIIIGFKPPPDGDVRGPVAGIRGKDYWAIESMRSQPK
jgi:hypothetical protein